MTFRSVLLGLLGVIFVCATTYFFVLVMRQTNPVANFLPFGAYGPFILFMFIVNPLLFLVSRKLAFSGQELAVAMIMVLASCCIPQDGLMRTFSTSLVMPFHWAKTNPSYADNHVIEQMPSYMLVDVNKANETRVLDGFIQGGMSGTTHINFFRGIPWGAWVKPLAFWIPVLFLFWIGLLGLSLVVNRQWADHEQLPYPIAGFMHSILPEGKELFPALLRNPMFWIAFSGIFLVHMNDYACQWWPNKLVNIPLVLDWNAQLHSLFPTMAKGGYLWLALTPRLYFSVIAVAYFIPTSVSLGLGIGPLLWWFALGIMAMQGISMGGGYSNEPTMTGFMYFGFYVGTLLVLLYVGRRYYAEVFRNAFRRFIPDGAPKEAVWGARIFLSAMVALVIYMSVGGKIDWQLSLLFIAIAVMTFLVMSRVLAETGLFYMQENFLPTAILLGLMGPVAFGPSAVLVTTFFMTVLLVDPREGFMPFMVNSFKLVNVRALPIGKVALVSVLALVVGLGVALPVTMYFQYDRGAAMFEGWSTQNVPAMPFDQAVKTIQGLKATGKLDEANALEGHTTPATPPPAAPAVAPATAATVPAAATALPATTTAPDSTASAVPGPSVVASFLRSFARFGHLAVKTNMLIVFGIAVALVLLFTAARLRFTWWPLHPVMFLFMATFPAQWFWGGFFIGWAIKALVTRFGGGVFYQKMRPFMYGMLAGELVGAIVPFIIGFIYYKTTGGQLPKPYNIIIG